MAPGHGPAPVFFESDPEALTSRERRRDRRPPVFATLVEDLHELRTVEAPREPRPAVTAKEAVLRLSVPGQRPLQVRLAAGQTLVIGRSSAADLKLRDPALSRTHIKVGLGALGVSATDLGSTNGSFLHGVPFVFARLEPGECVLFGQSILEVVRVTDSTRAAA